MKNRAVLSPEKTGNEGRTQAELMADIRRRAYELYKERGQADGHALDDWAQAEVEILEPERKPTAA